MELIQSFNILYTLRMILRTNSTFSYDIHNNIIILHMGYYLIIIRISKIKLALNIISK